MKYDLSILFYPKKSQEDKKGLVPIYMRITINGARTELSTNRKIEFSKWDSNSKRAKGRSEEVRALNNHLDNLENHIKHDFNFLNEKDAEISSEILRDMLIGKHQKSYSLVTVFESNNKLIELEEGEKYSRSTIDQYQTALVRIKLFLKQEYDCEDIDLSKLDALFIRRFEIFLKNTYSNAHNTIMKYLKELKKVIHFCMQLGYLDKDPFLQQIKNKASNIAVINLASKAPSRLASSYF